MKSHPGLPKFLHWILTVALLPLQLSAPATEQVYAAVRRVTSTADHDSGSLRQAMLNLDAGDTITFDSGVFPPGAPAVISLLSPLPTLSKNGVTIDASAAGVILDGSLAPAGSNGLILAADNCTLWGLTIRNFSSNGIILEAGSATNTIGGDRGQGGGLNGRGNLIVANGGSGIDLRGAGTDNNLILGNYIGIDTTGWWDLGNTYNGVAIWQGAQGNRVGGPNPADRNLISGNDQNGVWIGEAGSNANVIAGNYIGARADGLGAIPNSLSGISIQDGAQNNQIGGAQAGAGNLISGNHDHGIYIGDGSSNGNLVLNNVIGPNKTGNAAIGQGMHGILLTRGASYNIIGQPGAGNLISGNGLDGVLLEGSETISNTVQANIMGANQAGNVALPNGLHGIDLAQQTHDNLIGGDRLAGEGNLMSGNWNHGMVVATGSYENEIYGNIIGPDITGSFSLGNQPYGGIDITDGAHDNQFGSARPGYSNLVSGNQMDGIALYSNTGEGTSQNRLEGNLIGTTLDGSGPLPNLGDGIFNVSGALLSIIQENTIAYNQGYGVWTVECYGNTITQNAIYSNGEDGIRNSCVAAPQISAQSATTLVGTSFAGAKIELFSDDGSQGRYYEGQVTADSEGNFSYDASGLRGPNVTATSTDSNGRTSSFSQAVHLDWTILLYLNGDNDLSGMMQETFDSLAASGAPSSANVLVLLDGASPVTSTIQTALPELGSGRQAAAEGTALYDLTRGQATSLSASLGIAGTVPGELNMGAGQTLAEFILWGRDRYPSRHTLLSIVDHGGGWAPSATETVTGTLPYRRRNFLAGGSGLSWDFSSDYDYLDSPEIRTALDSATEHGAKPLDVLFYDVCLMGMLEVAYQVHEYAYYFVSSQNIGWAPIGPDGRYVWALRQMHSTTSPQEMVEILTFAYAYSLPPYEHPYTISGVDLSALPDLKTKVNALALVLKSKLSSNSDAEKLYASYLASQKIDYDADFQIEPDTDGFVDLYDFASQVAQNYSETNIITAANQVIASLETAVVARYHLSGSPWMAPDRYWNLDNVHGLSIYLPLGEDLELPLPATQPPGMVAADMKVERNLRLRDTYSADQLRFVNDTSWDDLIEAYYLASASPVPTDTHTGPLLGLQTPDITPPQSVITITGGLRLGQEITITWSATDADSGVSDAELWLNPGNGWQQVGAPQYGTGGEFAFFPSAACNQMFAVRAEDAAGNLEPFGRMNSQVLYVPYCFILPLLRTP